VSVFTKETMPKYEELVENRCSLLQMVTREGAGVEHTALGNVCDGRGYWPQAEANGTPADGRLTTSECSAHSGELYSQSPLQRY
jgi:hypothetical protein